MVQKFTFFLFLFLCIEGFTQQRKISYLPEQVFGKREKSVTIKKPSVNRFENKFSTFYLNNYKKLPIKRVPEKNIRSNAKDIIIEVQNRLNYLSENYLNEETTFDATLGNRIAEIKNFDKNWNIDYYFQELYFYEYYISKREKEKIWNTSYLAKKIQDSTIRIKKQRLVDSLRLSRKFNADKLKELKAVTQSQ